MTEQTTKLGQKRMIDGVLHVCVEDNGDRGVWMAMIKDMAIKPTAVYSDEAIADCKIIN